MSERAFRFAIRKIRPPSGAHLDERVVLDLEDIHRRLRQIALVVVIKLAQQRIDASAAQARFDLAGLQRIGLLGAFGQEHRARYNR